MIKFCQNCYETKCTKHNPSGYTFGWKDEIMICPNCNHQLINIDFPANDLYTIKTVSNDSKEFIDAMIELYNKDKIEYQLKMSQFKVQETQILESKKQAQQQNIPKCPTCGSTKLSKVSTMSKAGSVFMWGLLSQKVKKTWHCGNCGYEW